MDSRCLAVSSNPPVCDFSFLSLCASAQSSRRRSAAGNSRSRRGGPRKLPGKRVLMFGRLRELALYRAEVLRAHGFSVVLPASNAEAIAAIHRGGFDVAVLSYTLSNDTVEEITELLRQHCPACRLITISETRYPDLKINPDANVLADDGPKGLLEALRR